MTPPRLVGNGVEGERRMAGEKMRKKRGAWSSGCRRRRRREEGLGGEGEGRDDGSHGSWKQLDCGDDRSLRVMKILYCFLPPLSFGVYLLDPLFI